MKRVFIGISGIASLAIIAGTANRQAVSTQGRYQVIEIKSTIPGRRVIPISINDRGEVVGELRSGTSVISFVWRNGQLRTLRRISPSGFALANDINEKGQIAGVCSKDGIEKPILWEKDQPQVLDGTSAFSMEDSGYERRGNGINEKGSVSGTAPDTRFHDRAFSWTKSGGMKLLPLPDGGCTSSANDINDKGVIVGSACGTGTFMQASVWDENGVRLLGTLGGTYSHATCINNRGLIAGVSSTESNPETNIVHAFVYQDGHMHDLGGLPGCSEAGAEDVNDAGVIVGWAAMGSEDTKDDHAVLWRHRKAVDLNTLIGPRTGWVLDQAFSINNKGEICGTGTLRDRPAAFLLKPEVRKGHLDR